MFFDQPFGSPLDPMKRKPLLGPLGAVQPPMVPPAPTPALMPHKNAPRPATGMQAAALATKLPTPPATVERKRLNMWDKEHISGTLAEISKGLLTPGASLLQGIGAAGINVADRAAGLKKAEQSSTEIGGPDNAFEITTGPDGQRTFRRIEEVSDYLGERDRAKSAPKPKDTADWLGDSMYAVEKLPEEQRPGAYQLMIEQGRAAGHSLDGIAPPEYSPTFAKAAIQQTIGARQGSANEATAAYRAAVDADRDEARASVIAAREAASGRASAAAGRAAESHSRRMRPAPPSKRRSRGRGTSDLDYLR